MASAYGAVHSPESHQELGVWSWAATSPGDQQSVKCAQGGHLHCSWYHAIKRKDSFSEWSVGFSTVPREKWRQPTPLLHTYPEKLNTCLEHDRLLLGQYTSLQLLQGTTITDLHRTPCSALPNFGLETILSMESNLLCVYVYIYRFWLCDKLKHMHYYFKTGSLPCYSSMHRLSPGVLFFSTALLLSPPPLGSLLLQRKLIDVLNMYFTRLPLASPWCTQL